MQTKYLLKLEMDKLKRQQDDVLMCEKSYYSAMELYNTSLHIKNDKVLHKTLFTRMEDARSRWWKSIDKKMDIEQNIKVLEKQLVKDVMEETK